MSWRDSVKKTIPKANGRQVNMLLAKARMHGMNEKQFMEWLEYDSGLDIQVLSLEDIPAPEVSRIDAKLDRHSR